MNDLSFQVERSSSIRSRHTNWSHRVIRGTSSPMDIPPVYENMLSHQWHDGPNIHCDALQRGSSATWYVELNRSIYTTSVIQPQSFIWLFSDTNQLFTKCICELCSNLSSSRYQYPSTRRVGTTSVTRCIIRGEDVGNRETEHWLGSRLISSEYLISCHVFRWLSKDFPSAHWVSVPTRISKEWWPVSSQRYSPNSAPMHKFLDNIVYTWSQRQHRAWRDDLNDCIYDHHCHRLRISSEPFQITGGKLYMDTTLTFNPSHNEIHHFESDPLPLWWTVFPGGPKMMDETLTAIRRRICQCRHGFSHALSATMKDETLITVSLEPWKRSHKSIASRWERTQKLATTMCPDGMSGTLRSRSQCPSLHHQSTPSGTILKTTKHLNSFETISFATKENRPCSAVSLPCSD